MTKRSIAFVVAGALFIAASPTGAARGQQEPVARAFEHYERIRAALAQDTTQDIAAEAKTLSPLARDIAGDDAGRAATSLAQPKMSIRRGSSSACSPRRSCLSSWTLAFLV